MADRADAVIEGAAVGAGFTFVDVCPAFTGHGVCGPGGMGNEWLLRIKNDWESYHPTATGQYAGYLPPVSAAIEPWPAPDTRGPGPRPPTASAGAAPVGGKRSPGG
ncbi:hypothetical protein [Streptomyces sp. NPDC006552]|uniref:hypothetical protein n=1 Tax=Streptomyces sp. NPDC006552 TaxID=3157179 RepID=UPI0033A06825